MNPFTALLVFLLKLIVVTFFGMAKAHASDYEDLESINRGMPEPVKQFNARQIECNHWAGEESYDEQRAEQIRMAIENLSCESLETDEKFLLNQYKSRPDVKKSIHQAKDFI